MTEIAENVPMRPTISEEWARSIMEAGLGEARSIKVRATLVLVDESGVMKALVRMDGAPLISVQTAMNKAYAAAAIGMPPDEFYSAIESDGAAVASFATRAGLALISGGMPILVDGQVAGAVGVAGAMTGAEDRQIAEAALSGMQG
jgi:glc operon protein GlcG